MSNLENHGLEIGQEVSWLYTYPGGYGRTVWVAAKVIKLNPKKCRVEVTGTRRGEKVIKQLNADYDKIKQSSVFVMPEFMKKK